MPLEDVVIGFDLDMTLLDSRPGIRLSLGALSAETGVPIDADVVIGRLGPKLEDELAHWFPIEDVPAMCARYRAHYYEHCVDGGTFLLPGARASVEAVHARGGRVLAVTAKSEPLSKRCLDEVGLRADVIVGHVHGDEKRDALIEHGATAYVGDTIADVRAAVDAGVHAIGVATGMHDVDELTAAGATIVMRSLEEFPAWLARVEPLGSRPTGTSPRAAQVRSRRRP
jgi:phosphoglycolate phosphatase